MEKLRYGFTTGSCAAAAAAAAAYMLISGKLKEDIIIDTPKGIPYHAVIHVIDRSEHAVSCGVEKDGGDDIDATTGMLICARVEYGGEPGIVIDGGEGIGRVTRRGLDQPVGNAAINSVPRRMITQEVQKICRFLDYREGLRITIYAPQGETVAEQTFNSRLGIVGGISILGTTGIVEPMSVQALLDTIHVELAQRRAEGHTIVAIAPGNYGLEFMRQSFGYDLDRSVKCSNFIGQTLDDIRALGFQKVLLTGHIGKLIKVSGGIMNTHSHEGDCRMELLVAAALRAGAPNEVLTKILACVSTEDAVQKLKSSGYLAKSMAYMMERIMFYLQARAGKDLRVECMVYSNELGLLGASEHAGKLLEMLVKEQKSDL